MNKRILVLERDRDILEIVTVILNERGCTVLPFQTEEGVYDKILELMPDAILLDIVKLSEFGTKLCRTLKEAEKTKNIPVIVLSTHPKAVEVKKICADEVLSKPFDLNKLVAVIEEHLLI